METKRANRVREPDSAQGFVAPNGSKFELVKEEEIVVMHIRRARQSDPLMYGKMTISIK